jgi:hypothetical protein
MKQIHRYLIGPSQEGPIFVPDLVRLGLEVAIELASPMAAGQLRAAAREQGFNTKSARGLGAEGVRLQLPVCCNGRVLGVALLELVPVPMACGIRFAGRSSLSFNPIALTRSLLYPDVTAVSLDGRTNFLPQPATMDGEYLAQAVSLVALVADTARAAIDILLPSGSIIRSETVRLQAVEAAHDFLHPDATSVALAACHVALCQGRIDRHDAYYRSGASHDRVPTARHQATQNGPMVKAYPKTLSVVRVEVSCPTRASVNKLCGVQQSRLVGEEVMALVTHFLASARELGMAALEDVRTIAENTKSLPALTRGLEPLLRAAEGNPIAGGYRLKEDDRDAAERAYQDLLRQGRHWAKGAKAGSGLRRLLDSLCEANGPLTKADRGPWYFLKCDFAQAVQGLSVGESQRPTEGTRAGRTRGEQERGKKQREGMRGGENGSSNPLARR